MHTAASSSTAVSASRAESALAAASPAVHASSKSITAAGGVEAPTLPDRPDVQRVLEHEFKLPPDVAKTIAT